MFRSCNSPIVFTFAPASEHLAVFAASLSVTTTAHLVRRLPCRDCSSNVMRHNFEIATHLSPNNNDRRRHGSTKTDPQVAANRRSTRLAGGNSDPLQSLPTYVRPFKSRRDSTARDGSPTIAASPIVIREVEMTPQRLKSGNQKDLKHSSGSDMVNTDKENMAPYQHLYDRIKQNPRNATKRSQPNALQRTSTSKHQAVLQQSKKSVPALQSDFSYIQDHPAMRGTSALPTPAPTSTDSDLTGEEEEATRLAKPTGSPRTSASLVFSENEAPETDRPTRANKREAVTDPGCDSQPLAKRSRSVSSQHERGLEGHGLTSLADPPYESIEALQTHFSHQPAGLGATQARQIEQVDRTSTSKRFGSDETPANTPVLSDYDKRAVQDIAFIERMRESLSAQSKGKTANVGKRQARRILDLLQRAKSSDDAEALILSADEAKAQLQANQYFSGPIITEGQQPLDLQTIQDFLSEQYNDDAKVCIQDPSVRVAAKMPHTREITIGMLKEIFQKDKVTGPCNCLELASHVEDGLRPAFLNTEDCRLLTKLKHPSSEDKASRRSYEPGWKEVEKWALLAKAGALTEPHQDSHGYSTYVSL